MVTFQPTSVSSSLLSRFLAILGVVSMVFVTGGCDGIFSSEGEDPEFTVDVAFETLESRAISIEEIDRGQFGDIVEGTQRVLRDEEAFASFWDKLHADQSSVPNRPDVDFSSRIVVAVVLGQRPSGGFSVEVDEVLASEDGESLQVQFSEVSPGEECGVITVLTSPYTLVTVEAQSGEFTFSRTEKTRSC